MRGQLVDLHARPKQKSKRKMEAAIAALLKHQIETPSCCPDVVCHGVRPERDLMDPHRVQTKRRLNELNEGWTPDHDARCVGRRKHSHAVRRLGQHYWTPLSMSLPAYKDTPHLIPVHIEGRDTKALLDSRSPSYQNFRGRILIKCYKLPVCMETLSPI